MRAVEGDEYRVSASKFLQSTENASGPIVMTDVSSLHVRPSALHDSEQKSLAKRPKTNVFATVLPIAAICTGLGLSLIWGGFLAWVVARLLSVW